MLSQIWLHPNELLTDASSVPGVVACFHCDLPFLFVMGSISAFHFTIDDPSWPPYISLFHSNVEFGMEHRKAEMK
jgi:hypothetical protein